MPDGKKWASHIGQVSKSKDRGDLNGLTYATPLREMLLQRNSLLFPRAWYRQGRLPRPHEPDKVKHIPIKEHYKPAGFSLPATC
ncbi:hypothetical protein DUNSADRAFT_17131 [Dunaliella salina]|uniref:Encoded protein n=1 Tax=Dunaliella salina TaxID=3046 RepID=A0ABQ7G2B0_DUNSA|nr:hypothetical protein DUNSADRAFT_17131 [Dunaliella salina]|eukprot:KAF5828735.1 hypothetical protein DUNSADRAFT_17131 [Dunaliella salina]